MCWLISGCAIRSESARAAALWKVNMVEDWCCCLLYVQYWDVRCGVVEQFLLVLLR